MRFCGLVHFFAGGESLRLCEKRSNMLLQSQNNVAVQVVKLFQSSIACSKSRIVTESECGMFTVTEDKQTLLLLSTKEKWYCSDGSLFFWYIFSCMFLESKPCPGKPF